MWATDHMLHEHNVMHVRFARTILLSPNPACRSRVELKYKCLYLKHPRDIGEGGGWGQVASLRVTCMNTEQITARSIAAETLWLPSFTIAAVLAAVMKK
jgi:hypothetical protein